MKGKGIHSALAISSAAVAAVSVAVLAPALSWAQTPAEPDSRSISSESVLHAARSTRMSSRSVAACSAVERRDRMGSRRDFSIGATAATAAFFGQRRLLARENECSAPTAAC